MKYFDTAYCYALQTCRCSAPVQVWLSRLMCVRVCFTLFNIYLSCKINEKTICQIKVNNNLNPPTHPPSPKKWRWTRSRCSCDNSMNSPDSHQLRLLPPSPSFPSPLLQRGCDCAAGKIFFLEHVAQEGVSRVGSRGGVGALRVWARAEGLRDVLADQRFGEVGPGYVPDLATTP